MTAFYPAGPGEVFPDIQTAIKSVEIEPQKTWADIVLEKTPSITHMYLACFSLICVILCVSISSIIYFGVD